ncbi:MmcQ/YjbR family DNA-binding protein [Streptococcus sp. sy010]|uniref:MmcQ/YjbR family DNA-binding protein n=1 Tax=Streptococcus sp. sy010 TaxID=2600148 RepID=UPI0011B53F0D|nr:MmcQ/YjbR family DNA-binding protein [Streptococcus sp. sy010]TWT16356.1 MmcQ family protein [Streptococcus sp. sy010]
MSLESSIFTKKRVLFDRLMSFGFVMDGQDFYYRRTLMAGDFEARVWVSASGQVSGQVWDCEMDEPYEAIRREYQLGAFVTQVKEAYIAVLQEIALACYEDRLFEQEQANRLGNYLKMTYGDDYDYPFVKHPNYLSYRVAGKWYALIFPLNLAKLGVSGDLANQNVEVINLKVPTQKLSAYLDKEGIYPAYHMSKKSWISVVLDDSLSDKDLFELVDQSRQLVMPKSLAQETGPDFWVIPANPKYYDIDREFAEHDSIEWTQKAKIKAGDVVLIYMTAPTRALRYLCRVLEADIRNQGQRDNPSINYLMRLERLKTYADDCFNQDILQQHNLKTIRGPRRLPQSLVDVIKSQDSLLLKNMLE